MASNTEIVKQDMKKHGRNQVYLWRTIQQHFALVLFQALKYPPTPQNHSRVRTPFENPSTPRGLGVWELSPNVSFLWHHPPSPLRQRPRSSRKCAMDTPMDPRMSTPLPLAVGNGPMGPYKILMVVNGHLPWAKIILRPTLESKLREEADSAITEAMSSIKKGIISKTLWLYKKTNV